jgi:hypothetical protein
MWTGGLVPGPGDDAEIGFPGITVTHTSSASDSVNSLTLSSNQSALDISNGSLSLGKTSSIAGNVSIEGATLSTSGGLTVTGSFTNNGTVNVQSDSLTLQPGTDGPRSTDAAGPGRITGTFQGAAGTAMALGYQDLAATASINGADVTVEGYIRCPVHATGTLTVGQAYVPTSAAYFTNADFSAGNISLLGSLGDFRTGHTVTTGNLTLDGASLTGTDSFVVNGTLALVPGSLPGIVNAGTQAMTVDAYGPVTVVNAGATLDGVTFNNHGTATLAGGINFLHGSVFNNLAGATIIDQGGTYGSSNGTYTPGSGQLNNAGSYAKQGSAGTSTWVVPLNNMGSLSIQAGSLQLNSTSTNSGTVTVSSGTTLGVGSYYQTGGATILNAGTINGGSLSINAGSLTGTGTINSSVSNGGQVIPGGTGAAGILTMNGNYTQTTTGALNIELGGTTAGSQFDQLAVSGTALLAGTMNISLINTFQPAFGNSFQVLTLGSSSGNFATYNGTSLASGLFLDPAFNATSLTLDIDRVTISGAPAFPLEGIPINLTALVTGPSSGNSFTFSWNVNQNGNPFTSSSGSTFTFTPNLDATYVVTLTVSDVIGGKGTTTLQLIVAPSIFVVNPSVNGALTVSGNASINIPGEIVVDSSSSSALSAAGSAQMTASTTDVLGGFQTTGNATITPAPTTGVSVADPLVTLGAPSPTALTSYGSVTFTTGSHIINPGIYSQIKVSGNASLTMSAGSGGAPGMYIIEGGGLTVTGGASLSGQNVFIYNTGSNYPGSGGNFGGITLSGNGAISLSAPTSGTYAGIVIFQSRANTRALSFSGNAMSGISGIIYAPSALLSFNGNSQLQAALDVGMLNLSGNVTLTQTAEGSDGTGDTSGIANTLLAGDLNLHINDPSGLFTTDELARIQDAIDTWDALLAPYNVTITEVTDPTQANMVIDIGTTSACGGMADGVLGCFNAPNAEITMIQGWNWYAGADPTQIGPGQYDFETTVLHELGHALGLGGSTNSSSPMYETLASGVADRTVTPQDLNIPDPPSGADPQTAARLNFGEASGTFGQGVLAAGLSSGPNSGPVVLMPEPADATVSSGQWSVARDLRLAGKVQANPQMSPGTFLVVQGVSWEHEHGTIPEMTTVSTTLMPTPNPDHSAVPAGEPTDRFRTDPQQSIDDDEADPETEPNLGPGRLWNALTPDSVLDELAADLVRVPRGAGFQTVTPNYGGKMTDQMPLPKADSARERFLSPSPVPAILFAVGLSGQAAIGSIRRNQRAGRWHPTTRFPRYRLQNL